MGFEWQGESLTHQCYTMYDLSSLPTCAVVIRISSFPDTVSIGAVRSDRRVIFLSECSI